MTFEEEAEAAALHEFKQKKLKFDSEEEKEEFRKAAANYFQQKALKSNSEEEKKKFAEAYEKTKIEWDHLLWYLLPVSVRALYFDSKRMIRALQNYAPDSSQSTFSPVSSSSSSDSKAESLSTNDLPQETRENGSGQSSTNSDTSSDRTTDEVVSTSSDTNNAVDKPLTEKKVVKITKEMSRSKIPVKKQSDNIRGSLDSLCSISSSTAFYKPERSSFKPIESYRLYKERNELLLPEGHPFALEKKRLNPKLVKPALSHRKCVRVTLTEEEVASILEKQQSNTGTLGILGKKY